MAFSTGFFHPLTGKASTKSRHRGRLAAAWETLLLLTATPLPAQDWPQFRGPSQDGTATAALLERDVPLHLELDWKRPLGSGYASISVAGGCGVTLFSDGVEDLVTAFTAADGKELWRYSLGDTYRGHDGSSDGPLSTPAIADGTVYALGPRGQLVALDLDNGQPLWTRDLAADAPAPQYGFATAPLVEGELVIVQTGGSDGRSITAFERASGNVRWTAGDDPVSYQSPALLELGGRRRLIAAGDYHLIAVDPASGETAFRYRHTEDGKARGGSGHPLRLADDRLLFRPGPDEVAVVELSADGPRPAAGAGIVERWRSDRLLKRSHAAVVPAGGCLCSFDAQFLTCLDPATGERLWKSRLPGGRSLIRVGRYLVILSLHGEVVLAEADVAGYRQAARLAVLERGDWAPPSFAQGSIFVRNLSEMARVGVVEGSRRAAPESGSTTKYLGSIANLARRLATVSGSRAELVDDFLASQTSFPIVEDRGLVHFVYRGRAEDVALSGNMTASFGEEVPMERLPGTDLWVRSDRLDPDGHFEYRFHVDFGDGRVDPRNPLAIDSIFGASSELRMPGWPVPGYLVSAPGRRGRLEEMSFDSEKLRLYLPPGYDGSDRRYPLLWIQGGEGAEPVHVKRSLDHLIGERVAPLIAVLLPARKREHDVAALEEYSRLLTGEVLPELERRYRILAGADERAILGSGGGAPVAIFLAFGDPGAFGKVAVQSFFLSGLFGKLGAGAFSLTPGLQDEVRRRVTSSERLPPAAWVEWSRQESRDPSSGLDVRADSQWLLRALADRGLPLHRREVTGAPGWGSWRAGHGQILETLFPSNPGHGGKKAL